MIRLIYFFFFLSLPLISSAFTIPTWGEGAYVGLSLGETSNHYSVSQLGLNNACVHYQGFSGRAYLGYLFNHYIGMEAGFLRFAPARINNINYTMKNGTINDYDIDVLLVGNLTFQNGYFLLGKFGPGYHLAKPSTTIREYSTSDYRHQSVHHYRPVVSVGMGYALTKRIGLEANYIAVLKHRTMPRGTLWSLGIIYHFEDYYCFKTLLG